MACLHISLSRFKLPSFFLKRLVFATDMRSYDCDQKQKTSVAYGRAYLQNLQACIHHNVLFNAGRSCTGGIVLPIALWSYTQHCSSCLCLSSFICIRLLYFQSCSDSSGFLRCGWGTSGWGSGWGQAQVMVECLRFLWSVAAAVNMPIAPNLHAPTQPLFPRLPPGTPLLLLFHPRYPLCLGLEPAQSCQPAYLCQPNYHTLFKKMENPPHDQVWHSPCEFNALFYQVCH